MEARGYSIISLVAFYSHYHSANNVAPLARLFRVADDFHLPACVCVGVHACRSLIFENVAMTFLLAVTPCSEIASRLLLICTGKFAM